MTSKTLTEKLFDTTIFIAVFTGLVYYGCYLDLVVQYNYLEIPEYLIDININSILAFITKYQGLFFGIGIAAAFANFQHFSLKLNAYLVFLFFINLSIYGALVQLVLVITGNYFDTLKSCSYLIAIPSLILSRFVYKNHKVKLYLRLGRKFYDKLYADVILFFPCIGIFLQLVVTVSTKSTSIVNGHYIVGQGQDIKIFQKSNDYLYGKVYDVDADKKTWKITDSVVIIKLDPSRPVYLKYWHADTTK